MEKRISAAPSNGADRYVVIEEAETCAACGSKIEQPAPVVWCYTKRMAKDNREGPVYVPFHLKCAPKKGER